MSYSLIHFIFHFRVKAKDLIDFIQDDNRLREERKKAKKNKDKYVGVSSDSMGFRGSGGSKCSVNNYFELQIKDKGFITVPVLDVRLWKNFSSFLCI